MTNIRVERAKKDISQSFLAQQLEVNLVTVQRIERNTTIPSVYLAWKIAKYFNLEINDFEEFNY
jgi:putative transcriptional regulator